MIRDWSVPICVVEYSHCDSEPVNDLNQAYGVCFVVQTRRQSLSCTIRTDNRLTHGSTAVSLGLCPGSGRSGRLHWHASVAKLGPKSEHEVFTMSWDSDSDKQPEYRA